MTMPRRQLVDVAVTRYYHCISRCVRRAFLCSEGVTHRKAWIEARLEVLAKHFAVSVCGFGKTEKDRHNRSWPEVSAAYRAAAGAATVLKTGGEGAIAVTLTAAGVDVSRYSAGRWRKLPGL